MKRTVILFSTILFAMTAGAAELRIYVTDNGVFAPFNLEGTDPATLTNRPGLTLADILGIGFQINDLPSLPWQLYLEQLGAVPASGWISFELTRDQIDVATLSDSKFTPYFVTTEGPVFFNTSFSGLTTTINDQPLTAMPDGNYLFAPASQGVVTSPIITTAPGNLTVNEGGFVRFAVIAESILASGDITYQWFRDGIAIPGARDSEFVIQSAVAVDAGNYSVTVTDPIGTITLNASLTVGAAQAMPAASLPTLLFLLLTIGAFGGHRVLRYSHN